MDRKKLNAMEVNCIISLTSHGIRLKYVHKTIDSILKGTYKPSKIILTVYKDDIDLVSDYLKNKCEIIIGEENLKSHLKYFYAMKKYKDLPIITIDDDCFYPENFLELLWKSYLKYPDCVFAYRVHQPTIKNNKLTHYGEWKIGFKEIKTPNRLLMPTGVGGVLYPENILGIANDDLKHIKEFPTTDDIFLFYKELKKGIKIVYVPNQKRYISNNSPEVFNAGLCLINEKDDCYLHNLCIDNLINKHFNFKLCS